MPEYIEREAALKTIDNYGKTVTADAIIVVEAIKDIVGVITPAADVVEVVRCKDCKYLLKDNLLKDKMICTHKDNRVFGTAKTAFANAFCSCGERKE